MPHDPVSSTLTSVMSEDRPAYFGSLSYFALYSGGTGRVFGFGPRTKGPLYNVYMTEHDCFIVVVIACRAFT